jgi:glycosyltransferase involved in cell wall biosynthesis
VNYHSGEAPDHLARSAVARFVLRRWVDLVVVPSPFLRDVFFSFGIHAAVVPNTVDTRRFPYRVRSPLRPRLLSTRNFEPIYNVACTLRAFAHVQQQYPDASLTLVGGGSEEPALRRLAAQLQLRHVTFTGPVNPADIPSYYANADIYVQTPAIDNMPLSVLEAFASGLPVVSTRVGGVPAILADGVQGLLAPDGDAAGIAFQILRLLERPELARQLAAAAHESCAAYQWSAARDGWLRAYDVAMQISSRQQRPSSAQSVPATGNDHRTPVTGAR